MAAALSHRRLRPRHHHRRHDRRRLLGAGQPVPRLWRGTLRQVRRAPRHVLDVRRLGRSLLPPVLPAHRIRRAGHPRAGELPPRDRALRLHSHRVRARFLHEPGQGRRLQAHPGLLPQPRGLGRRRGRPGRRPRRIRAADPVRRAQRPHRRMAELLHGVVRYLRHRARVDAHGHPSHGEGRLRRGAQEAARAARDAGDPRGKARRRPGPASHRGLAAGGQGVLELHGPQDCPAQPHDLGARVAAVVCRVDGVVGGGGQAARRSASPTPPTSCSGLPRCPGSRARRSGSSIPSWCRSSAAACGPR